MQNGSLLFSPEGIGTRKLKLGKKKKKKKAGCLLQDHFHLGVAGIYWSDDLAPVNQAIPA